MRDRDAHRGGSMEIIGPVQIEMIRAAAAMMAKNEFDHLLYIGDLPLPEELVKAKSTARRKLVQAVTSDAQRQLIEAIGVRALSLPTYDIARRERFKMALVTGIAKGVFREQDVVLGIIGRSPTTYPDTMMIVTIGGGAQNGMTTGFGVIGADRIPSAIMESVIELAVEIGRDGWEGRPLGTLLVVGDSATVMEKSHQLTLNPFQGYSEAEKNILNPEVRDAIRNFAVLDGAFVIRDDGVVLAAGRYLKCDDQKEFDVPLGLGARHVAAAGISQDTSAIAIVVSETTGMTRVYQTGSCVLEIHADQRRRRTTVEDRLYVPRVDESRADFRTLPRETNEAAEVAAEFDPRETTRPPKEGKGRGSGGDRGKR